MAKGIEVFFATNRNVESEGDTPKFGKVFNPAGPQDLRFGAAMIEKTKKGDYKVAKISLAPEAIKGVAKEQQKLGSDAVFEALREKMMADHIDVICLIHGYASRIEDALERAGELKDKYRVKGREPHVCVFSWPSDGELTPLISYHSDRDDARVSGSAIARAFLKLRDYLQRLERERHCQQSIHLVAHSMGNYALRHGIQALRREIKGPIPRMLDNVFLMAADEDDDAFEHDHKLRLLSQFAQAVHVYYAADDRALVISDFTKQNPDRLGAQGPRLRDGLPRRVNLIDCSAASDAEDDYTKHQYYRLRPEVVADVNQVLSGLAPAAIKDRLYMDEDRSYQIKPKPAPRKGKASAKRPASGGRSR